MRRYRSSIPKVAKEHILATYIAGPQKYKSEYRLGRKVVGVRYFENSGALQSEVPLKDGKRLGTVYFFEQGAVVWSEPHSNGFAHGTARQWSESGDLIGTYNMKRGTGLDLWRCERIGETGSIYLSEARYLKDGMYHGFEWWLNEDQRSVHNECHFWRDHKHGIERVWNVEGRFGAWLS